MKSIVDFNVEGKKVLVRCDFNVPIKKGEVLDDFRIRQTIPTIEYLIKKRAKIILISHLGRPGGIANEKYSLKPVVARLNKLLNKKVKFLDDCLSENTKNAVDKMDFGDVVLLENLRFYKGEEENDEYFTKSLVELGDIYINDAFSVCHREHASVVGLPKYLPSGIGLLFEKELKALSRILENPERPLVVIIGGVKVANKIKAVKYFISTADHVLLGGQIANVILRTQGISVGASQLSPEIIKEVKSIKLTDISLHLPVDVTVCLGAFEEGYIRYTAVGNVHKDEQIFDLGPETVEIFSKIIEKAKTILWSGPLGYVEDERFAKASLVIADRIIKSGAFSVVGGGDTDAFLNKYNLRGHFSHVSTGGGAMLLYLSGEKLPGIEALSRTF